MKGCALRLRPLTLDDEQEARAAHAELAADEFTFLLDWEPEETWTRYLERCDRGAEVMFLGQI